MGVCGVFSASTLFLQRLVPWSLPRRQHRSAKNCQHRPRRRHRRSQPNTHIVQLIPASRHCTPGASSSSHRAHLVGQVVYGHGYRFSYIFSPVWSLSLPLGGTATSSSHVSILHIVMAIPTHSVQTSMSSRRGSAQTNTAMQLCSS